MFDKPNWVKFKNANAGTVPARGIVRVTGISIIEDGDICLTVDQPNVYGDVGFCMVNGPVAVPSGSYGVCTRAGIISAYYDSAQTPAQGDQWGPINASWKMTKGSGGWISCGAPTNTSLNLALFIAKPLGVVRGQLASDCATDTASGTFTVWTGASNGSALSPTQTIPSVFNASSCTIKASKTAAAYWFDDGGGWQFVNGHTS
jgi:hypothetical protein